MITRVALVDGVTPAVGAWLQDLNPASARALLKAGRLIRTAAVRNIQGEFRRTGQNRTGTGARGVKVRRSPEAGLHVVRVWHGSGILAAHELGSTIPPTPFRRTRGGRDRGTTLRRAFTLRRRPTLEPAYLANQSAILALLEAEYTKVLALAPPAVRT